MRQPRRETGAPLGPGTPTEMQMCMEEVEETGWSLREKNMRREGRHLLCVSLVKLPGISGFLCWR